MNVCPRYNETSALRAVGCPALAPALTALRKRVVISSQVVSPSPCCNAGITRNSDQSSLKERLMAESVTSRPISGTISATVMAPRSASSSYTRNASGVTLTAPLVSGGRFHPLSPRKVKTNGNAAAETMKSGTSPGPPSRFNGSAEPSPTMRATSPRAVLASAGVEAGFSIPSVASTREGAGAPRGRGAKSTSPCSSKNVRAASSVRSGSPA